MKKWDVESITEESRKYERRVDFMRGSAGAYDAAKRRHKGLMDMLFPVPYKRPSPKWNKHTITEETKKYETKVQFMKGSSGAYGACLDRFPGLIDELFTNVNRTWDENALVREANKYKSRKDFINGSRVAYFIMIARFPKLIDTIFEPVKRITLKSACDVLIECKSITQLQKEFESEYKWLRKHHPKLIHLILPISKSYKNRDIVYVWCADEYEGIYKVGITSTDAYTNRIESVKLRSGFVKGKIVIKVTVRKNEAIDVERILKKLGRKAKFEKKFDGYTEFRRWTSDDLTCALFMIKLFSKDDTE
jgi:hypothetical protein